MKRRTKVVATIGPASSSKEMLKNLIQEGVDVCRLNFSHGAHEDHVKVIKTIREIISEINYPIAILADLQGPKIRVGTVKDNGVELVEGKELVMTTQQVEGTAKKVSITYETFPQDVKAGEKVLVDDGKLVLEVVSSNYKDEVVLKVLHGGILSSKKGVNLPNTSISQPSLTVKDRKDLELALQHDIDWVALSFVRSARDIIELKHLIKNSGKSTRVIAKIEKPEAIEDLDDIIKQADGIMVARGDLGVEIPMENVPLIQKQIINKSIEHAKPVIVATQMMESMIENISPTRAEVNDVANAVMDGADAVMLSGETSVGKHPRAVIDAMNKIIMRIEDQFDELYSKDIEPVKNQTRFITDSICFDACRLSKRVDAKAIVTMTNSGYTAFKISSQRPKARIFVYSGNKKLLTTLSLVWGVKTFFYDKMVSTDHTIEDIKYMLKKEGYLSQGDLIINTASMPIEELGSTNMLKLSSID
ncbi:MAG: pyruvate kinase [Flavobacteriales bacterium]|jgi:pyruvate kinase|nr:pyruvate kinase [Flavobacteriales bacterium]